MVEDSGGDNLAIGVKIGLPSNYSMKIITSQIPRHMYGRHAPGGQDFTQVPSPST
jgi:hypothetical protein